VSEIAAVVVTVCNFGGARSCGAAQLRGMGFEQALPCIMRRRGGWTAPPKPTNPTRDGVGERLSSRSTTYWAASMSVRSVTVFVEET